MVGSTCYVAGRSHTTRAHLALETHRATPTSLVGTSPMNTNSRSESPAKSQDHLLPQESVEVRGFGLRQRLMQLQERLANMDASSVLTELKALRYHPSGPNALVEEQLLLARYAEVDPETALTYVEALDDSKRELGVMTVLSSWASQDPEMASAYVEENLDDFGILDQRQADSAGVLAGEWARSDPEVALDWAESLPEEVRGEVQERIMAQLVAEDPAQALAALDGMPPGYERREMLESVVGQWAHGDPAAAAAWVTDQAAGDERLTASLMSSWMQDSPMEASHWLSCLPDSEGRDAAIVAMTASRALLRDPEAATVWSSTIGDQSMRAEVLQSSLNRWFAVDPAAAEAWWQTQAGP